VTAPRWRIACNGSALNFHAAEADTPQVLYEEARDALAEGLTLGATPRVDRALRLALARSQCGLGELARAEELAAAGTGRRAGRRLALG
jgi:hypothetical protein